MADGAHGLAERLSARDATVAVIGLGYVGLPLVDALHDAGHRVLGLDDDAALVDALRAGRTTVPHLGDELFARLADSARFDATSDPRRLADVDAVAVCVPTPLGVHREPDLSAVRAAARAIGAHARRGVLAVLESTTYPGTTRDVFARELLDAAAARGEAWRLGHDVFVAFSPEREDPGRTSHSIRSTPRLVGGLDERSGELAAALYRGGIDEVVVTSSAEVAESAKLLENVFRAVNIALVNETKTILSAMDVDVWEVIDAAATKPFGFMPFKPGPGLGGHCIPIDPYYFSWKARELGHEAHFVELAGEINRRMPRRVVERLAEALNDDGRALRGARVLLLGVAYKADVGDTRETPAAELWRELARRGGDVRYHDPHVPAFDAGEGSTASVDCTPEALSEADVVLVVTDHRAIDWAAVGRHASLIVDTRNVMASQPGVAARVVKA